MVVRDKVGERHGDVELRTLVTDAGREKSIVAAGLGGGESARVTVTA